MKKRLSQLATCLFGGIAAASPATAARHLLPVQRLVSLHRANPYAAWNDGDRAMMNAVEAKAAAVVVAERQRRADADYGAYFTRHPDAPLAADFRRAFGPVEMSNNCYSFALNSPAGHGDFATPAPGAAAGIWFDIKRVADGDYIARLAEADGVRPLPADAPVPGGFYRVALFIAPGREFHWYREDADGSWYHKRGHMPVTDRDAAGHIIRDPRRADRDYRKAGGADYAQFQGFFIVPDGGIDLDTPASHNQHPEGGDRVGLDALYKLLAASQTVWPVTPP